MKQTQTMWHLSKTEEEHIIDVVAFDELELNDYKEDGFELQGRFSISLQEGSDNLPGAIGD